MIDTFAGFDVGKKRNPSQLSGFKYEGNDLIQIHESFLDEVSYTEQADYLNAAAENWSLVRGYYDNTRGELEERNLHPAWKPMVLTHQRIHGQLASKFEKWVHAKRIRLINNERFISQILCVDNALKAPETAEGHGDCYDQETEILTEEGWKYFNELNRSERVATLREDNFLEWQYPTGYIEKDYKGKMYKIASTQVDLLVTPQHKLYSGGGNYGDFKLRLPHERFNMQSCYKKNVLWKGKWKNFFTLPAVEGKRQKREAILIPMNLWLEFLGYYISEGHTTVRERNRFQIGISQGIGEKRNKIKACILELPFNFWEDKSGFWISNFQLGSYLCQLGKSIGKHIPLEFMNLSSSQLMVLYEALMLGDGTYNKTFRNYATSSKKLAGQVQEILLKIGKSGNIYVRDMRGRKAPHGITRELHYIVSVIEGKNIPMVNKNKMSDSWVDYEGKIYCVTVPNHIIYVRRNGKPVWSGNSFWGVVLAIVACEDFYPFEEGMGKLEIGDMAALYKKDEIGYNISEEEIPKVIQKVIVPQREFIHKCPNCGKAEGLSFSNDSGNSSPWEATRYVCLVCMHRGDAREVLNG